MASRRGLAIDGVLLLDKPEGLSSNHALQRARRCLNAQKGGHTGTLDPFATGLMILCFGEATKFSGYLFQADKSYRAHVRLGEETDSGDLTGLPVPFAGQTPDRLPSAAEIETAAAAFLGPIEQIPPMYSALKRDGKKLYEYARQGIEVERAARAVTLHSIAVEVLTPRDFILDVRCSKGTYIRTLAQDIGRRLGCGAHLTALRRTSTAGFTLDQAWTLDRLEGLERPDTALLPLDVLLPDYEALRLDDAAAQRFMQGQTVAFPVQNSTSAPNAIQITGGVRVSDPNGKFLGTARAADGWLHPDRLIAFKEKS
ncbi:MAG: tRNA pseudouridine(55) synthase TruB [Pigmentiphaga sp.]|nr:tRNA pseudouridine(55) synthase TruB [Pigmentiphaga sp.]